MDSIPTKFFDLVSETQSFFVEENEHANEKLSMTSVFQKPEFQLSYVSTASSLKTHLEVPDVFNRSSFVFQFPIIGSKIYDEYFKEEPLAKDEIGLFSLLIYENVEIDLPDLQTNLKCFLSKFLSLSLNNPYRQALNPFLQEVNDISCRNFSAEMDSLLFQLKLYIEMKHPVLCALIRFSFQAKVDKSNNIPWNKDVKEIISFMIIFFWIYCEDKLKINECIELFITSSTPKSVYTFYLVLMKETNCKILAF
ncbi:MAG: hypothetical protein EOO46_19710 [Flavobacterium sp.]|nr:MAG: hypothetical protein EOO46_19710 [Flavobacterium sp.]